MKWLKLFTVFAVVLAALLCVVPNLNAQCVNGQCARLGPPVVAVPGAFLGGPVVLRPAAYVTPIAYAEPVPLGQSAITPAFGCQPSNHCQQPVFYACGSGARCGPDLCGVPCSQPVRFAHNCQHQKTAGIGIGISWGRGYNFRGSTNYH